MFLIFNNDRHRHPLGIRNGIRNAIKRADGDVTVGEVGAGDVAGGVAEIGQEDVGGGGEAGGLLKDTGAEDGDFCTRGDGRWSGPGSGGCARLRRL